MLGLIDCNNFYVSCERAFRPDLTKKPVIVLSNNDGCVISRSKEAKYLGIKMGIPYFKIKELCHQQNIVIFSSNYSLYADMSQRIMSLVSKEVEDIEIYSIDECFVKFKNFDEKHLINKALQIQQIVLSATSIPISIGLAKTKVLAKTANFYAKNINNGLYLINDDNLEQSLLNINVDQIWGIGRQNALKLQHLGIRTAKDLTKSPRSLIKKLLTVVGLRIQEELQQISCLELEQIEPKKNISSSRSFGLTIKDISIIKAALGHHLMRAHEKLKTQDSCARGIYIMLRSNKFSKTQAYQHYSSHIILDSYTDSLIILTNYMNQLVDKIFKPNVAYYKAGIVLFDIINKAEGNLSLFNDQKNIGHEKLSNIIFEINQKTGKRSVFLASSLTDKPWRMRRDNLSPNYTTDWNDILIIKDKNI